jgi:FKBP-type peptidyl-prolyl cis-trans isomerase FkpA
MFCRRLLRLSTIAALLWAGACGSTSTPAAPTVTLPTGPATLQITDLVIGTGTEAAATSSVFINYTLWRYDPAGTDGKGLLIQTSVGGSPYPFTVGSGTIITGVSQGVIGMKVGGKRLLLIPPSLAYGTTGTSDGAIRPNEWIVFEIELLSVV